MPQTFCAQNLLSRSIQLNERAIPLLEGFAAFGIKSAATGYKRIRGESGFPQPFYVGRRGYFLESEIHGHLVRLAARRGT